MNIDFSSLVPDKSAAVLAVITALAGWGLHALIAVNAAGTKLDEHTVQIQKLWEGQKETHETLSNVNVTLARIDGKIDTLNQKVDDDRAAHDKKGH